MSGPIGKSVSRDTGKQLLARSRERALLIPDLLVEAKRVANSVLAGWHGRKRRGIGENFWQFRPYVEGENLASIDWRRSAREVDQIFVKDREWQASHTIWFWVDESPSMLFQSESAMASKQSRALVIAFALAELLAKSGERIGWLGVHPAISHRHAAERLGEALLHVPAQEQIADTSVIRDFSDVILISDFLSQDENRFDALSKIAGRRVKGHILQIVDPAEENFPYAGRVEFTDPESGEKQTSGSAQSLKEDYVELFEMHTHQLADISKRLGWSHTKHHTDKPASEALVNLHLKLSSGANDFVAHTNETRKA